MKPAGPSRLPLIAAIVIELFACPAGSTSPPAEAFATLPAISDVALSPNGNLLAWADRSGAVEKVIIYDLSAGKIRHQVEAGGDVKLRDLAFADDEIVLVGMSQTEKKKSIDEDRHRLEYFRTLGVDVNTGKSHILLMNDGSRQYVTGASLALYRTPKPRTAIMYSWDWTANAARGVTDTHLPTTREDSGWVLTVFEVNTESGKGKPIESGNQFTEAFVVNLDGRVVARSDWNPKTRSYRVLAKKGAGWKEICNRTDDAMSLHGVSVDGSSVIAIAPNDAGRKVLYSIALDGSGLKVLFEDPGNDVLTVYQDPFSLQPVGVWLGGTQEEFRWIDAQAEARFKSVSRAFPHRTVLVQGRSADGKRMLASVSSASQPAVYYLVDFGTHKADIVGDEYPALADIKLGDVRAFEYKARDGVSIPAYLTLPPGSDGKELPLVVLPHGGPESRDYYSFDWWAQFLASRGYAVLQPQFRGSTGFGSNFRAAGYKQWGLRMQDDVTDGVKALIADGTVDARRVCIVGASYGGYAALAGAAFTPDVYKCAVSVSGISDIPALLAAEVEKRADGKEDSSVMHDKEAIGTPYDKNVIERSPARYAPQIRIPVLLIHGLDDTVVPIAQSEMMAHALDAAGKTYSFVRLSGEDHWMSRAQTRLQIMQEIEKFLAANL